MKNIWQASSRLRALTSREIERFLSVFIQTLFPPIVSSFLFIFIFGYSLGRNLQSVSSFTYLQFLIPGLLMMYIIESSYQNAASSLFVSRWSNYIEEILVTPLSYFEMVVAFLVGGLVRSLIIAGGVFLVSCFFSPTIPEHPWLLLYFAVMASLGFGALGLITGLIAEEFEHLSVMTTFILQPLIYFGGVFHSMEMVPSFVQTLSYFNPIFYLISGLRYAMIGWGDVSVMLCMVVSGCFFTILFLFAVTLFKMGYKLRI